MKGTVANGDTRGHGQAARSTASRDALLDAYR